MQARGPELLPDWKYWNLRSRIRSEWLFRLFRDTFGENAESPARRKAELDQRTTAATRRGRLMMDRQRSMAGWCERYPDTGQRFARGLSGPPHDPALADEVPSHCGNHDPALDHGEHGRDESKPQQHQ
jgi:hypothetical protein